MDVSTVSSELSSLLESENCCEYTDIEDNKITKICLSGIETFNVLHLNIRSLIKNVDSLTLLLSELQESGVIIHALGLCETFLNVNLANTVQLENYVLVNDCRVNRVGGGTVILVHDSVKLIDRILMDFNESFESTNVLVKYKGKTISINEIYRPPNSNDSTFMNSVSEVLNKVHRWKPDISFICTDQNYDLLKTHLHKPTCEFLTCLGNKEFAPTILKPTRITHKSGTLIDNIYAKTNKGKLHKNWSFVITDGMSDHFPCLLAFSLGHTQKQKDKIIIEKRKFNDTAILNIQQDLLFFDWSPVDTMSINDAYEFLIRAITSILDRRAPMKLIELKPDHRFREAWMTVIYARFLINILRVRGLMCKSQLMIQIAQSEIW